MRNRDSDLVEGIQGGFETALAIPRVVQKKKVNTFLTKARSLFDDMQESPKSRRQLNMGEVLVEETQFPILRAEQDGRIVDQDGNLVDLERYGISLHDVVPETQLDETIDVDEDFNSTQNITSAQPTPFRFTAMGSTTESSDITASSQQVPQSTTNTSDASVTINSTASLVKKRKLTNKEPNSDFFEEHLLEMLDAGTQEMNIFFQQFFY